MEDLVSNKPELLAKHLSLMCVYLRPGSWDRGTHLHTCKHAHACAHNNAVKEELGIPGQQRWQGG